MFKKEGTKKNKRQKRCIQHFIYWNSIYWNYTFQYNITSGWYFRKCKNSMALYYCVLNQQVKNIAAFHRHHCLFLSILKMFRRLSLLLLFSLQFLSTSGMVLCCHVLNQNKLWWLPIHRVKLQLLADILFFFIPWNRLSW